MRMADDLKRKARLRRNRICARIQSLLRATVAPSGFSPLPARRRKRGERQPAPFPAPFLFSTPDLPSARSLNAIDLQAMREVEGAGEAPKVLPP